MSDDISAFTQTYSTAHYSVTAATAVAVGTTGATQSTPYGYTTAAQADAIVTAVNALIADVLQLRKNVNAIIDEVQNDGIVD